MLQHLGTDDAGAPNEDQKAEPDLRERQRELGGRRRFEPAFAEKLPQRGKEGSEENDIDGVDRLEHRCRHAADIDIALVVEVKAAARLLEQAPKHRTAPAQEQARVTPVPGPTIANEP